MHRHTKIACICEHSAHLGDHRFQPTARTTSRAGVEYGHQPVTLMVKLPKCKLAIMVCGIDIKIVVCFLLGFLCNRFGLLLRFDDLISQQTEIRLSSCREDAASIS